MTRPLALTLVSTRPRLGGVAANLTRMKEAIASAKGDLVVFGEMSLTGYAVKDEVRRLAEPLSGPSVATLAEACAKHGKRAIVGMPRRDAAVRGRIFNSAVLVGAKGAEGHYDKWFLANFGPFEEKLHFAEGHDLPIWDVGGVRVAPSICYDLFAPELYRTQALLGADLLLNISASPTTSRPHFERVLPARAIENACYVGYCNVAGPQDDVVFWGGSQLWGPRGDVKGPETRPMEPAVLECAVDPAEIEAARPFRPTLRDARAELFERAGRLLKGEPR